MPKFGPEFWVRLKHPNSRINQYQPGTNLYQSGIKLYQTGTILYQTGTNLYQSRFSYTERVFRVWCKVYNTQDTHKRVFRVWCKVNNTQDTHKRVFRVWCKVKINEASSRDTADCPALDGSSSPRPRDASWYPSPSPASLLTASHTLMTLR